MNLVNTLINDRVAMNYEFFGMVFLILATPIIFANILFNSLYVAVLSLILLLTSVTFYTYSLHKLFKK